jgi:uncharacterized membrane protein
LSRFSRLRWSGLILLVAIGIIAAIARVLAIANVAASVTEAKLAAAQALYPAAYAEEIPQLEQHFAVSPRATLVHVIAGAVFLALGLLQFSARIRNRHLRFHRRSGRLLVVFALFAGTTGLWLGIVAPYSSTERLPTAAAGAAFLIAPAMAIAAVRRGDIARHREWMIRFFAVGVGIVVIRLVQPLIIFLHSPVPLRELVGLTFWAGWLVAVTIAELWIRATRIDFATLRPGATMAGER